ncbi:MAG: hypothetical protein K2X47_09140 [Bdellovibrionales bacterium]|nr:hypothetical protein [Bdellovibrionales bacterium]
MDQKKISSRRRWSKDSILAEILKTENVSAKRIQQERSDLYSAAVRYFGSWKSAVEAAGHDYSRVRRTKTAGYWTGRTLIDAILELREKNSASARKTNPALYIAALRYFGSWEKAVLSAGLDYKSVQKGRPKKGKGRQLK